MATLVLGPPSSVLLVAGACVFAVGSSRPAVADEEDATCSIDDPGPEDMNQTWLSWMTNSDGTLQPQFEIRALSRADVAYELEGRVNFGGDDITWEQGPYFLSAEETSFIDVEIPSTAFMDALQVDYTSTLVVRVIAYDTTIGLDLERQHAPRVKLVWTSPTSTPLLYDEETAALVAPGGIVSEEIRSRSDIVLAEPGYIYEYAPQP